MAQTSSSPSSSNPFARTNAYAPPVAFARAAGPAAQALFSAAAMEHPSLKLLVTDVQRDRAVDYLQQAYAEGRLTSEEFEERLERALAARTRRDLNAVFDGLVLVPLSSQAVAAHPAYNPLVNQERDGAPGRAAAGLAHLSAIFMPLVGPAIFYAATKPGTFARLHATRALNFTVIMMAALMVFGILDWGALAGITALSWFVLNVIGATKGFAGEDFENPVLRLAPLKPFTEKPQRRQIGR